MDVLDREILGEPITVTLAGAAYPVAFPMFAVTLYKQETAKLNCRRAKAAEEAGRARLTAIELRDLKRRYRALVDAMDGDASDEFAGQMEEAVVLRCRIDEETGNGDSLLQLINWWKIREEDPERIVLALWAGLHQQESDDSWKSPVAIAHLNKLIDFSNVGPIVQAITRALMAYMPKRKEASPNAETLEPARVM
jgi:hypothetical protein